MQRILGLIRRRLTYLIYFWSKKKRNFYPFIIIIIIWLEKNWNFAVHAFGFESPEAPIPEK